MNERKKIMLVDDNKAFIEALKVILSLRNDVEVIAEAYNGKEFTEKITTNLPDIVLLDINMPLIDGITAANICLKINPNLKLLAVTMSDAADLHRKIKNAGFTGAILKTQFSEHFDIALDNINKGEQFFPLLNKLIN
ncbi:MAG TPA: response regulator transcription factor [Prolixibacteraceae bacterium]|nr:response regulator transcription factor [Prolixibacteraceae bacterium]HPR61256.1 response regulator transcription factor [Prolixibacteraceae bacterium]